MGGPDTSPPSPPEYEALTGHLPSHRDHLRKVVTDVARRGRAECLDAIVMPVARRLDEARSGLELAADLVREMRVAGMTCPPVVLLCSKAADARHVPKRLLREASVLVVDVAAHLSGVLPHLATARHPVSTFGRSNDVGLKRNLGLVLARSYGWRTILMLDDDVSRLRCVDDAPSSFLSLANLADASLALDDQDAKAAGWVLEEFPDNSVVCHARRLVGLPQDRFLGGGALLLRCNDSTPFFPATYNEDWLFLLPFLLAEKYPQTALAEGGILGQDTMNVYRPERARSEELGDTLGEGLFNLLRSRASFDDLSRSETFWRHVIARRTQMIEDIREKLCAGLTGVHGRDVQPVLQALDAALAVHRQPETGRPLDRDWARAFASYCQSWASDLQTWGSWFSALEPGRLPRGLTFRGLAEWRGRRYARARMVPLN